MLHLPAAIREAIGDHAAAEYPRECCGILLGDKREGPGRPVVCGAVRAVNSAAPGTLHNRYIIDPLAILQADKSAREQQLDIVGFYHSHPDHPAIASQRDMALAWPDYVYVIAAITGDGRVEIRGWRLIASGEPMQEVGLR